MTVIGLLILIATHLEHWWSGSIIIYENLTHLVVTLFNLNTSSIDVYHFSWLFYFLGSCSGGYIAGTCWGIFWRYVHLHVTHKAIKKNSESDKLLSFFPIVSLTIRLRAQVFVNKLIVNKVWWMTITHRKQGQVVLLVLVEPTCTIVGSFKPKIIQAKGSMCVILAYMYQWIVSIEKTNQICGFSLEHDERLLNMH